MRLVMTKNFDNGQNGFTGVYNNEEFSGIADCGGNITGDRSVFTFGEDSMVEILIDYIFIVLNFFESEGSYTA